LITESVAASAKPDDSNKIRMRSNQEMLGLGVCNLVGSFFQNFPVTGALSRSAVQKQVYFKIDID
jgi:MFS superfamily sulfate permease-like transporter